MASQMEFFHVGFFPKRCVTRENWHSLQPENANYHFPAPAPIDQLCSVSSCIVKGLVGFDYPEISENSFNQYGGFNQLATALDLIRKQAPGEFELYAYGVPEVLYEEGQSHPEEIGCVEPDEIEVDSPAYDKLGYDVVELRYCSFMCSPLSCNGQAGENRELVNQYCLVENESDAIKLAIDFSINKPEPGPYVIVEVWKYVYPLDASIL